MPLAVQNLIVQKYGGSSVSTVERLKKVASRIVETQNAGHPVVAVVSAMGKTTDQLLNLATEVSSQPAPRELDLLLSSGERVASSLLAMAVQELGQEAVALTGPQCGIRTTEPHTKARVIGVHCERVRTELESGRAVIVAGFQGANSHEEITTLGRGGSDTTAVALAAALGAERCEICSDVDGVYSADPRVVPEARRLDELGYEEMGELARHGARVLHVNAVRLAQREDVTIHARASFSEGGGTVIHNGETDADAGSVAGVAGRKDLLHLRLGRADDETAIRELLAERLDDERFLFRTTDPARNHLDLVVAGEDIADTEALVKELEAAFPHTLTVRTDLGSVSAIGPEAGKSPEMLERNRLSLGEIPILGRFRSPWSLSSMLAADDVDLATQNLHRAFVEQAPAFGAERTGATGALS